MTADGNSTLVFEWGDSVEWRVSAQAGVEDRLVWMLDGQELVAVAAAGQNHNMVTTDYYQLQWLYNSCHEVSQFRWDSPDFWASVPVVSRLAHMSRNFY